MSEITITITADEDDLRGFAFHKYAVERVADAIAAALPKPRIVVKPGMVLRRKSDGRRFAAQLLWPSDHRCAVRCLTEAGVTHDVDWRTAELGLDPDEWEVILDV